MNRNAAGGNARSAADAGTGGPPIEWAPSPNHGPRRGVMAPDMVVIHYTAMASAGAALDRLRDPSAEVSAHYLIGPDGAIVQLVSEARRAWHAGVARWGSVADVNSHSIGIELANPGPELGWPPYPAPQMEALEALLWRIRLRWGLLPERVLGHSDVAPGRKIDPGEKFDWRRLALRGLAVWSDADGAGEAPDRAQALACAARLGYCAPVGAGGDEALIRALQMRFAPEETGAPLSARLTARLRELAAAHPADGGGGAVPAA